MTAGAPLLARALREVTAEALLTPARKRGVRLVLLRLALHERPATAADLVALAEATADKDTREGRELVALASTFPDELHTWAAQMLAYAGRRRS